MVSGTGEGTAGHKSEQLPCLLDSGMEVFSMVIQSIVFGLHLIDMAVSLPTFIHEASCEVDDKKRDICMRVSPNMRHMYRDVVQLSKGPCYDFVTETIVSPDAVDAVVAGFSCKDLSYLHNANAVLRRFHDHRGRRGKGTSSTTFEACADCIEEWRPSFLLLENVGGLLASRSADGGSKPIDRVDERLRVAGFVGAHRVADSLRFGVPQRRKRIWLVYFLVGRGDAAEALRAMKLFHHAPLPLMPFLKFPPDVARRRGSGAAAGRSKKWVGKVKAARKAWGLSEAEVMQLLAELSNQNTSFASMTRRVQMNLASSYLRAMRVRGWSFVADAIIFQVRRDVLHLGSRCGLGV